MLSFDHGTCSYYWAIWRYSTLSTVKDKKWFIFVFLLQMARYTTPMYRAPEMVDTWSNHAITVASDVWALGCIIYTLCYMKHPFEDSAKLRILNGNYTIPPGDVKYSCYHDIIRKYVRHKICDITLKCIQNTAKCQQSGCIWSFGSFDSPSSELVTAYE